MITCIILILSHYHTETTSIKNLWLKYSPLLLSSSLIHFDFFFIEYNTNITHDYIMNQKTKILTLKGEDSIIPGCFLKTIKSIEIIQHLYNPDFILRTNISTIFNFKKIIPIIQKLHQRDKTQIKYFLAGPILELETLDDLKLFIQDANKKKLIDIESIKNKEILNSILNKKIDKKSIKYIHGIFMLMDRDSYSFLVNNYTICNPYIDILHDDILISLVFKKNKLPLICIKNNSEHNTNMTLLNNINHNYVSNNIFFRCKIDNCYLKTYEYLKKIFEIISLF